MSLQSFIINQANYNVWVTEQYINWLSNKPAELFTKEVASSYPSLYKTLAHIADVQTYWLEIIEEKEPIFPQGERSLQEIFDRWLNSSKAIVAHVESLSSEELEKKIKVVSPWFQSFLPRYEYIQHTFGHGLYHRGQLVTMGRVVGITDAPMTDYNFFNIAMQEQAISSNN